MIFTEREAAAKRCTPMQVIWLMPDRDTRQAMTASGEIELSCIGSRCAQWRWFDVPSDDGMTFFMRDTVYIGKGQAMKGAFLVAAPARGFCGLAGCP